MKSVLLTFALATALVVFAGVKAEAVELSETPAAVQAAVHARVAEGKVEEIDQTNEDGETTFDVTYTAKSRDEQGFTLADDGTVLSVEVELAETPAAVQKAIRDRAEGWELHDINQNLDDTETTYEAEVSKGGRGKSFTIAADGELRSEEVTLAETPAAVQATVRSELAAGTWQSISENFDADGNSFDVEATAENGGRQAFAVGMDGQLLSVEVPLNKVPPAARRTIQEKIGGGKVLHIDKSLVEKKDGVPPFEVQARKDGRPFNFSVGPRGRFLGMDE